MAGKAAKMVLHESRIRLFHELHQNNLLLLPNAWDCVSAKIFQEEGAPAMGTTSAGVAASLGFADGQQIPTDLFLETVGRIIASVTIPVSVDMEAGYGSTSVEICETVRKVIDLGAAGINIEDTDPVTNELMPLPVQVKRLRRIRQVISDNKLNVFLNARTDVYWSNSIPAAKKYDECLIRLSSYKTAGASGVFVPGISNIEEIGGICKEIQLPLNILGGSWISKIGVADLRAAAGVSRISIGSGIHRAAVTSTQDKYREFAKGDLGFLDDSLTYDQINNMFK